MTRKANLDEVRAAAAIHWATYFGHYHKRMPALAMRPDDDDALEDIVRVQALGKTHRALALIEQVIRAPIPGNTLTERYAAFWHWTECRRPKRYTPPSRTVARDIRDCIRDAA